jgi:hypothetical protein
LTRFVAAVAPLAALVLAGAAFVFEDQWLPAAAAAAGAVLSLVLAAMLLRLDRRWRLEVAVARAAQAAEYAAEYERYTSVHRSFTSHVIGLLDAASDRLGVQRRRIEALEAEVTGLRVVARPAAADPTPALATFAEGPEWNELWPDLADAPTVVDLLKWDERMQHALLPDADADDHRDERTA